MNSWKYQLHDDDDNDHSLSDDTAIFYSCIGVNWLWKTCLISYITCVASQTKSPRWSIINFRFISYWCIHATKGVRWSTDHFISTKNNKIDHKLWPCSFECFNTVKCQNFFCICMLFVFVFVLLFVFVSLLVFVFRGRNIVTINVCPTLIYDPASIGLCTFLYLCHPYQIRLIRQINLIFKLKYSNSAISTKPWN